MKKACLIALFSTLIISADKSYAQCSICTRTAQQMGEKPAKALNAGIIYLAFAPFAVGIYVGYRWWKNNRE